MKKPALIIVTGFPGTGKTTLAKQIGERFNLPVIYKDGIKESLFDSLGWSDKEWSQKLGGASFDLVWLWLEEMLKKQVSLVVEANFDVVKHSQKLEELRSQYGFEAVQVICKTDVPVLLDRFKGRVKSGERHPGHVDDVYVIDYEKRLLADGEYHALEVTGEKVEVDTTDFEKAEFGKVFEAIEKTVR
jgi:predicted kinase